MRGYGERVMRTRVAPAVALDEPALARAVRTLARAEPRFAHIVKRHGPPPLWPRDPGFQTLVLLMLEQQVSLAQGRAMYTRISNATGAVTPASVASAEISWATGISATSSTARARRWRLIECALRHRSATWARR